VEKPDEVASRRIVSGDVRTLMPVAVQASQGKIVDGRGTAMLTRDKCGQGEIAGDKLTPEGGSIHSDFRLVTRLAGPRPGSLMRSVVRLSMKSHPGPGLHYSEQVSDMQVAIKLCPFFGRQSAGFRTLRQLFHPLPVAFSKRNRQQVLGNLRSNLVSLGLYQSSPNSRFPGGILERRTHV
jgi:hypothetical protein